MIALPERQQIIQWVEQANTAGARSHKACELLGIRATHAAALVPMWGIS